MMHDYLIIGQGLAGSVLATMLLQKGKSLAIVDEQRFPTSSTMAAGLMNPFTGPKMVKSWKIDELFSSAQEFYRYAEKLHAAPLLSEHIMYRPFTSVEEQNDWHGKSTYDGYRPYIERLCETGLHSACVNDPFGGVEIKCFVLHTAAFVERSFRYFTEKCTYLKTRFDEDNLTIESDSFIYQHIQARRVIFCTGYQSIGSRYFHWLPIVPVKGELLKVKFDATFKTIYNRSCFIIPQDNGTCKVGSTYDRNDTSVSPTASGRQQIIRNMRQLSPLSFQVTDHSAGIRPGTVARRPLMGSHPEIPHMFIFNGLGTKGVSLAPYFAAQFVSSLNEGNNLHDEVDIKRYYSLYFKSQSSTKK